MSTKKEFSLEKLQGLCSWGLSVLAKARMRTITDKGTAIGLRAKLFKEVIPAEGIGVELGVYKGTLSKFILETNQPNCLHLVDPWWKWRPEWHWAAGDKSTVRSFGALVIALADEIASGQVEIHIKNSIDALKTFEDGYLDWAYIDSTHSYKTTKAELVLLSRKINPNGIIAGDDWRGDPEHKHHGVCQAVKEFLRENPSYNLIFQEGTQWAIAKST